MGIDISHLPGPRRFTRIDDLITRGDHPNSNRSHHVHLDDTQRHESTNFGGTYQTSLALNRLSLSHILSDAYQILAFGDRAEDFDFIRTYLLYIFQHHDRVGPLRQHPTGMD